MRVLAFSLVIICILSLGQALCPPTSLLHRTYDGSCNNLLKPNWGKTLTAYRSGPEGREPYPWAQIPQVAELPTYADADTLATQGPRGNARDISNALCTRPVDNQIDPINHSMLSVMFGQFINHDMENNQMVNASIRGYFPLVTYLMDRNDSQCQEATGFFPHPYRCNDNDTVLTSEARITGGTRKPDGTFEPINNASAYLDLDHVYGRNEALANIIRLGHSGKLKSTSRTVTITNQITGVQKTSTWNNLLPTYDQTHLPSNPNFVDLMPNTPELIFTAGDERVNENIALTLFHTLFLREHNKNCEELIDGNILWKLFPNIFDELIYQKARAITIAKYQKVVYEEYFPSAFGSHFANKLGNYYGYNPLVETSTSLAFSGSAFRYGHFTLKNYKSLDQCGRAIVWGDVALNPNQEMIFAGMANAFPDYLTPVGNLASAGGFDNVIRGLINERSAPNDLSVLNDIRDLALPSGVLDLITLDISRMRFNTLPNYQVLRKHYRGVNLVTDKIYGAPGCPANLENNQNADDPIACFNYITSDTNLAQSLKNVYRKVNLIDGIIGVTAEDHVPGTSFSYTAGNIIVDQFKRYRDGDRFFYKTMINTGQFSLSERNDILGSSFSQLLKRNFGVGNEIPENPFHAPDGFRQSLIDSC